MSKRIAFSLFIRFIIAQKYYWFSRLLSQYHEKKFKNILGDLQTTDQF